jgi:hypothetical protein
MRKRGEVVERSFAHILERGGMRRTWLQGRENIHKRCLVHVAVMATMSAAVSASDEAMITKAIVSTA